MSRQNDQLTETKQAKTMANCEDPAGVLTIDECASVEVQEPFRFSEYSEKGSALILCMQNY